MKLHLRLILALVLSASCLSQVMAQTVFDQIGLTDLRNRLGASAPTGAGVIVMQGEATVGGPTNYLPNSSLSDFAGKTFTDQSGGGMVSGHATTVGSFFYGNTNGVAPGITQINNYRVDGNLGAGDWVGPAYLNLGGGLPVAQPTMRVQNHSWISTGAFDSDAQEAQRRYDFALRRDNVLGVVGVNNGVSPIPALLGNTYNGIAVGLTNGNSSVGPSTGDVPGRSKPDIVAPMGATSFATPLVAGAAALMVQTADQLGNPSAGRIETIKSALLTGATKSEFASLAQPWTRTNNGSYVEPLDRRFGAGQLNVNNSNLILTAGQKNGTDLGLDGTVGWDLSTYVGNGATRRYYVNIPDGTNIQLTASATWLRRITPTGTGTNLFATSDATLSFVTLQLFDTNPDLSLGSQIDSSLSPIDNVQYLYDTGLMSNHIYALEVTLAGLPAGQSDEDVAISWITTFSAVPEPQTWISAGVLSAGLGMVWWRKRTSKRNFTLFG